MKETENFLFATSGIIDSLSKLNAENLRLSNRKHKMMSMGVEAQDIQPKVTDRVYVYTGGHNLKQKPKCNK